MSWKEFKDFVDKQLQEKSIPETQNIFFIDLHLSETEDLCVWTQKDLGIVISE